MANNSNKEIENKEIINKELNYSNKKEQKHIQQQQTR
jgi:hypothetical protein